MKTSKTKKRFLLSLVAVIACVAMLVGTTMAWFTDSVTSGKNRIVAGNLDIEVTHTNAKVTNPTSIVGENSMFLDKNGHAMLWEPGAVSYENITVSNVGNLALKYKINMNVTDYNMVEDTGDNLKDAIKIMVLTGDNMLASVTRETVLGLDWTNAGTLESFQKDDGVLYPEGTENLPSEDEFQLIAYWQPTDNDNRWNLNNGKHNTDGYKIEDTDEEALYIDFGINVVATQKDFESDSFDNQYDVVDLPVLPQSITKKFQSNPINTTLEVQGGNVIVKGIEESVQVINKSTNTGVGTVKQNSVESVVKALVSKVGANNIKTVDSSQDSIIYIDIKTTEPPTVTGVTYDISLSAKMDYTKNDGNQGTANINELSSDQLNGIVTVTMNIGAGLKNVKVAHNDELMNKLNSSEQDNVGYFYNMGTGELTIKSDSFSPFKVTYDNVKTTPKAYVKNITPLPEEISFMDFTGYNTGFEKINEVVSPAPLQAAYEFKAFKNEDEENAVRELLEKVGITDDSQLAGLTPEAINDALELIDDPNKKALLTEIISSRADYLTWRADFTVSFDKPVAHNTIGLAGQYEAYSNEWVGFGLPLDAEPNTPVRLLDTAFQAFPSDVFHMSYASICCWVKTFNCGLVNFSEANIGTTATVSLYLYEVDGEDNETGNFMKIGSIPFTFTEAYTSMTD